MEGRPPRERGYQAINGAYRLIDEYLRQGQKMAEELWLPNDSPRRSEGPGPGDAPMRFMRAMGDMTMAWMEVMQQWTTTTARPESTGVAGPFTAGRRVAPREPGSSDEREAPPEAARSLRVSVRASAPVEVSVDLSEPTNLGDLVAGELRTFSGDAPPIRGASIDASAPGEAPVLRIIVPEGQPKGTYSGLLVEQDSQKPRGTISLIVS